MILGYLGGIVCIITSIPLKFRKARESIVRGDEPAEAERKGGRQKKV